MHDRHPAPSCTPGDVGDVLDESDLSTGRGQLRQARIGPDYAPLHFLDEERAMARRHEMGQAICLRPRGLGNTHPMIPIDGSPLLLAAPGNALVDVEGGRAMAAFRTHRQ